LFSRGLPPHLSARALQWQAGDVLGGLSTLGEMSGHNSMGFFSAKEGIPIPGCAGLSELKREALDYFEPFSYFLLE